MNGVRAEIELPLESRGMRGAALARAVEETALALGIADLLERPVRTLSGGELQRVALAAALVGAARLLLLDEPTSQLDPVAAEELLAQLRRLNEDHGTTVVLAEQRLERCLAAADRVIALEHGRVACDSTPAGFVRWAARAAPGARSACRPHVALAGLDPLPVTVKQARDAAAPGRCGRRRRCVRPEERRSPSLRRRGGRKAAAARSRSRASGSSGTTAGGGTVTALRGLDLELRRGETVALLGRNGAGKSTLLRVAAGLFEPARGARAAAGDVALLVQTPSDYLLHERVARGASAGRGGRGAGGARTRPRRRRRPARPLRRGAAAARARGSCWPGAGVGARRSRRPSSRSTSPRAAWTRSASATWPSASRARGRRARR